MTTTLDATPQQLQSTIDDVYRDVQEQILQTDWTPVWAEVIADLETLHDQYFAAEAGPAGAWDELAESTKRRKGHDGILWETKRLQASLVGQGGDAIRDIIQEEGNSGFTFGTEVEYAKFHMTGTNNMPARPMVGINEPEVDVIVERMLDHTISGLINV